ncbi:UDP-3-O-(3-hydroxymyristoyl)glucosamine N-acyltransferase [Alphaproteobacteria bacterium]|jgi:UDP-3-O-[3-hydroxymyristoyl] glucosamine N-acyltransferase|nr:UDP-3-O-(3-hydroxymyristoyl)glucosamine N-acyltransferase [Alphaproteobacteria bacterium]
MAIKTRFFTITPQSAASLAAAIGAEVTGDGAVLVSDSASIDKGGPGILSFLSVAPPDIDLNLLEGATVITSGEFAASLPDKCTKLIVDAPRLGFARALSQLVPDTQSGPVTPYDFGAKHDGHEGTVTVGPGVMLGDGVTIGGGSIIEAGAVIHKGVRIGTGCRIGANAVLSHCDLGDNVSVLPNTVIGSAGFGFEMTKDGAVMLPHVGSVEIGSFSHIGAGCCIDRGTLEATRIGANVMIDNLVHIAHNCTIADRAILTAQIGMAGGASIGEGAMLGGQAGIGQNVSVGKDAVVMAQSGVTKDVGEGMIVVGFPATEARDFWREKAALRRLLAKSGKKENNQ